MAKKVDVQNRNLSPISTVNRTQNLYENLTDEMKSGQGNSDLPDINISLNSSVNKTDTKMNNNVTNTMIQKSQPIKNKTKSPAKTKSINNRIPVNPSTNKEQGKPKCLNCNSSERRTTTSKQSISGLVEYEVSDDCNT